MMQTLAAGTTRTVADIFRLVFGTSYSSRAKSLLGMGKNKVLSSSMSSSEKGEKNPTLLDGRINFRARKVVEISSVKQSVGNDCRSDRYDQLPEQLEVDIMAASSVSLPSTGNSSCPGEDASSGKVGRKRGPTPRKFVESMVSESEGRRVTRKMKAISTAIGQREVDRCDQLPEQLEVEILAGSSVSLPSTECKSCPGEDATSGKVRTKQAANSRKIVEARISQSQERRVNRKMKATRQTEESPASSVDVSKRSTVDFWLSSRSEAEVAADHVAVNPPVALVVPGRTMLDIEDLAVAIHHLKCADSRLRTVIEMHDGPKFEKCNSAFSALVRSIVFQQLATKAASAIFGRVVVLCGGLDNLQPVTVSELSKEQLRAVGISERKASYLHDLAAHFLSGSLSDVCINEMDDNDLTKALTAVKGIGVWSVHMFMLFSLHRPDVLPVGDLGVRKGFQKLYQLKALPSPREMEKLSLCWQPYRSIGSWYMWRVLDMTLPF